MPTPPKLRILVVEDEKKTAEVLRLYLEHGGFEVTVARTGDEALSQARTGRPDLVLLDRMLPGLDGVAICRALRAESDVAIILVTARTAEEDRLEGLRAGADDYVSKPFSPREVLARVRAVLRRSKSERSAPARVASRTVELDLGERAATVRGRPVSLSRAEFDLLAAFARARPAARSAGRSWSSGSSGRKPTCWLARLTPASCVCGARSNKEASLPSS